MGSSGGDRRRRWVVKEIGGRGEKIGGGECLEEMGSRGGDRRRRWRRWVVEEEIGGGGGEKIGGGVCLGGGDG